MEKNKLVKTKKKGRHKLYKVICLFCIIALLLSNVFSDLVLAINDNPNGSSVSNQLPIGKIGNREKNRE